MNKWKFAGVLYLLSLANFAFAQKQMPRFLEGAWKMENRESYEYWSKLSDNNFKGFSYQMKNGEMKVSEYLDISIKEGNVVYTATVINQNQGQGVSFTLTPSDSAFVFENPEHDFPKKIVYKPLNENSIQVSVSDGGKKGFTYILNKVNNQVFINKKNNDSRDRAVSIPQNVRSAWEILTQGAGVWIADNSAYKNQNEPYDQFKLEWKYDQGKSSLTGKLYGIIEGKEPVEFWAFRTFWDAVKNKAIIFQISPNGSYGISESEMLSDSLEQSLGVFHYSNGYSENTKHQSITTPTHHITTSFSKDSNGNWVPQRTYTWYPVPIETRATSKIDTLPSGELMLEQEIVIDAPVAELWSAYTTAEAWKKWVTPVVEIDFKINGTIKSHYDPNAKIGDKGTIIIHILNYIPHQQITMQAEIAENFPEFMKGEEKNLYSIVEFTPLDANSTKVSLYGIGYKNETQWHDLMKFFIQGNEMTLNNLKKYAEH